MPNFLLIFALFVLPASILLMLSLRSTWRGFRLMSWTSFALWMLGLVGLTVPGLDCGGNLLYGFTGCLTLSDSLADAIVPRALLALAAGVLLYLFALVALGLRWWRARND